MLKTEGTKTEKEFENAMVIVKELLEECNRRLFREYGRDLMVMVSSRLKTSDSIARKLKRKGLEVNLDTAVKRLNDIAGVRVICRYQDDIYRIQKELYRIPDIAILKEKDFVCRPKKSGYRSLHIIVGVPVEDESGEKNVKVEIQIRTVVMHLWAELEHEKCYKKPKKADSLYQTLKLCAKLGRRLDEEMLKARKVAEIGEVSESGEKVEQ